MLKKSLIVLLTYTNDTIKAYEDTYTIGSETEKIKRTPRGVVLCMGPYNYPLNELFTTVIPALITGNVVIIKPARIGVLLFQPLLQCFADAFPAGVVNVIYGDGPTVITPLLQDGGVDSLAFIGSDTTADILMKNHPHPHRLHSVLGLGAKNPGIVLEDYPANAMSEMVFGALSYCGQRCTALKIFFVQRSVAAKFAKDLSEEVNKLTVGMPWDANQVAPHQTPLPEPGKVMKMKEYVDDAVRKGAIVMNGEPLYGELLMRPVVLYGVTSDAHIYNEEQFGPVVPIVVFDDIQEVLDYMANSPYGQQASLFTTQSQDKIDEYVALLQNFVCRININLQCMRSPDYLPFSGKKSSAKGVLSLQEALTEFTTPCVVYRKNDVKK